MPRDPLPSECFYPTAFTSWGEEEFAAIQRVIDSGRFTIGPETEALEAELAAHQRRKHCIAVNSGSSANLVAIAALVHARYLITGEDYAGVPALAWSTTYAPFDQYRISIRPGDCDSTWRAPGCLVAVPILGNPPDDRLHLLNDCCESLGAHTEAGAPATKVGLIATTSFYWSHQLSAIEGGAVLTDDDELAELCRLLRNHGGKRDATGAWEFKLFGYNLRPIEMHCAIAREQLAKLDAGAVWRRKNAQAFIALTDGLPVQHIEWRGAPNPFGLPFTVENAGVRARLVAAFKSAGTDSRIPCAGSLGKHPYGKAWAHIPTPNADKIHETGVMLGCAPFDLSDRIEAAVNVMRSALT